MKSIDLDERPGYILTWNELSNRKEARERAVLDKKRILSEIKLKLSSASSLNVPNGYNREIWKKLYENVNDQFVFYGKTPDSKKSIDIYNVIWPKQCNAVKIALARFPSAKLEKYMDIKGGNSPCMVVLSSNQPQTIEAVTLYQYDLSLFGQSSEIDVEFFSFER